MEKLTFVIVWMLLATITLANPIPVPPPANMPLEDMYVQIQPAGDTLHAVFTGDFTFTYIPQDVNSMLFPVPPDANNIGVWMDDIPLGWEWSSELYPTILPEMPTLPMIEWPGPFPEQGAVFTVDYEHDLIKRPAEFVFFYAVGTGKYFPTYEKTTTAYFDILLPAGFAVAGVWLDDTAHEYEVIDSHLMVTVQSHFGPIINDLIVSLVPTTLYVATDGNDVTGDGSINNPFRTIQKGIDTAVDGHTVAIAAGTYTGNGNRDIDFGGKAITVRSENGPDSCIMDCEGLGCGFIFNQQEDSNSIVDGFTIVHGCRWCGEDQFPITWFGAGIICEASGPTILNCVIRYNYAHVGAGICVKYGGSPTIFNCIIANNNGGGIYCREGTWVINCTITDNYGSVGGGGIKAEGGTIIINSILWDNTPEQIEVLGYTGPIVAYSDVQGGWPGNMDLNPLFADAANGDFHLKSQRGRWDATNQIWVQDSITSPCVDAGVPELDYTTELWPHGKRINMGAYGGTAQASMSLSETGNIADLNNDDLVNYADMMLFTEKWLWEKILLPADLNRDRSVDFSDFDIFADNWLW